MNEAVEGRPTFAACLAAARAVRHSEQHREVLKFVRPRSPMPLLRSGMMLTLQLFLAACTGRLVWFGAGAFAIVEWPLSPHWTGPSERRPRVVRLSLLHWDLLVFAVPPAVALLLAALCALALQAGVRPVEAVVYPALFLCFGAGCWVLVHLVTSVLWNAASLVRQLQNQQEAAEIRAINLYSQENWTLRLLHVEDPADVPRVLRAARDLITDAEPLLCVERGITTIAARAAVAGASGITRFEGDLHGILVLRAPGQATLLRPTPRQARDAVAILSLILLCLAAYARLLVDVERDACRPDSCEGRPVSYPDALLWLAYRLIGQTPGGLDVGSGASRFASFCLPLLGLIMLSIIIWAFYEQVKASNAQAERIQEEVAKVMDPRATVLVLVAATVERRAVMRQIGARNGGPTARVLGGGLQSIRDLGVLSSCRVLLAQTEQGTVDPGGMTLAAADIVRQVQPDYVILTGICFGLRPGEQSETDLLVATQVECLDWHKEIEDEDGTLRLITRGDRVATSVVLRDRARLVEDDWSRSKVHFGPVLSLNTLLNSRRRTAELRAFKPDAIGGEMEAAGVYAVGARAMTDWIVVKAISDWGYDKTNVHQEPAADAAAEFVAELIAGGHLNTPPGELRRPAKSS